MFLIIKQKTQKVPLHVKFMLKISIGITLLCKIIWLSYIFQKNCLADNHEFVIWEDLNPNRIILYYFFLLVGLSNLLSKRSIVINKSHSLLLSVVSHRKRFIQEKIIPRWTSCQLLSNRSFPNHCYIFLHSGMFVKTIE